ncbi:MAG: DUF3105 domain-containing protein, partial [Natronosporangium sp.]
MRRAGHRSHRRLRRARTTRHHREVRDGATELRAALSGPRAGGRRGFYTPDDRPRVEQLVHNLEHGYTVLWYLPQVPDAQREQIEG